MIRFQPQHFEEIRRFIYDFSGILLERVPLKGVQERIRKHAQSVGVEKISEYVHLLNTPGSLTIRDELMALVTVNESFFFRNPAQFKFLAETLLPEMHKQKVQTGCRHINIWSAGCATGEETYSLALLIEWYHRRFPGMNFNLTGTDLNTFSLEKAREGVYRKRSVRQAYTAMRAEFPRIPALVEQRRFGGEAGAPDVSYQVPREIREHVQFRYLNLHEPRSLDMMKRTDIIFCRNVLIYFDDAFRKSLLECFHLILNPGGYLFLGETESIPFDVKSFELVPCCGGFCYRKAASHETQK